MNDAALITKLHLQTTYPSASYFVRLSEEVNFNQNIRTYHHKFFYNNILILFNHYLINLYLLLKYNSAYILFVSPKPECHTGSS